jgi:protein involved in polysaccharide export with SLBB domain
MLKISQFTIGILILLLTSINIEAAEDQIAQLKSQCNNITAQQRQMAKAAGYDVDSLCSSIPTAGGQALSQPKNVEPRPSQNGTQDVEESFEEVADSASLKEGRETQTVDKKELKQFGYELFAGVPTTFAPATDIPMTSDYVVGPGDTIRVQLFGKTSSQFDLVIQRNGMIQFPDLGPIALTGLTFAEMKQLLTNRVKQQMIGVNISITMGELRSIQIFVLGEAYRPGAYTVSSLSTMMNALISSGGITKVGSLRNIQLKRRGKTITTLDLYDLLLKGDTSKDARLHPGDVLFVPTIGKVASIAGEVKRPAIYELKTEKTASDLLNLAGGLLPNAYADASLIERVGEAGDRTLVNINLEIEGNKTEIQNGDLLKVPSVLDRMDNVVLLTGHVHRPGGYQWTKGMRVSDLVKSFDDMLSNPDVEYALIKRESYPLRNIVAVTVNLRQALMKPGSAQDVVLHSRDELIIFDKSSERNVILKGFIDQLKLQAKGNKLAKIVSVHGNVYFPGEYPMSDDMSINQIIIAAGGLKEAAYLTKAELTRRSIENPERAAVEHISINLADELSFKSHIKIQPKDKLAIFTVPEYRDSLTVNLRGEIRFPGEYVFKRGETLSQVIDRAGGFTPMAHIQAAVFTRLDLKIQETKQLRELKNKMREDIAASELEDAVAGKGSTLKDAEGLLNALAETEAVGRLVLSIEDILSGKIDDVQLKNGDQLIVPNFRQEVSVLGEVQHATSHLFNDGLTLDDYLEKSGGLTNKADDDRIYVVKADGSVFLPNQSGWLTHHNEMLSPGDTIVVPLDTDRIKSMALWTSVSQIVYQLALGAAAVRSL